MVGKIYFLMYIFSNVSQGFSSAKRVDYAATLMCDNTHFVIQVSVFGLWCWSVTFTCPSDLSLQ